MWDQTMMIRLESVWKKVWKTIGLGTGIKNADGFRMALKYSDMKFPGPVSQMMNQKEFNISPEPVEVDLVCVSMVELGVRDGATLREIYVAAKKHGLELCPAEVGPQLRLQYRDQQKYERLTIGMEPILDLDGSLEILEVACDGIGHWLDVSIGHPGRERGGNERFVFVQHRK